MFTDIQETIARDMNCLAYNWEDLHVLSEAQDVEEQLSEEFVLSEEYDDLPWLRTNVREDWEFERGFEREAVRLLTVTSKKVDSVRLVDPEVENPWATRSGDNPVIFPLATLADMSCRLITEIPAPNKQWYSVSRKWSRDKWVPQERLFHATVRVIWKYRESPKHLRALWNKFWSKQVPKRLFKKHTRQIVGLFNEFGIFAKNDLRNID